MIDRYSTKEMKQIWSEENKLYNWYRIELEYVISLLREDEEFFFVNQPELEEVLKEEENTKHDFVAFINVLLRNIKNTNNSYGIKDDISKYIHYGLTSSDVIDTCNSMRIKESLELLYQETFIKLHKFLTDLSIKHKYTYCVGRTHGIHAEATTFGIKVLNWIQELKRNIERLRHSFDAFNYGKLSGPIGTYNHITPELETKVLNKLNLDAEPISTQIIPRDKYAELFSTLALVGSMIERIATEIRSLQRTEIGELEESFVNEQKGSSSMPHKKNPISSEQLCGLSRILRGYVVSAFEDINLWHERDISHSSVERIILPDAFNLVHYMMQSLIKIIKNLKVNNKKMLLNIVYTDNKIYSQDIMNTLIMKYDFSREDAYKIVQQSSIECDNTQKEFINCILGRCSFLAEEIDDICDYTRQLKNIDKIYQKVGL